MLATHLNCLVSSFLVQLLVIYPANLNLCFSILLLMGFFFLSTVIRTLMIINWEKFLLVENSPCFRLFLIPGEHFLHPFQGLHILLKVHCPELETVL